MFREILNYILEGLAILFMYGSLNSTADEGFLIEYEGYTVSYNPKTKIPVWVKYDLSAEETDGPYTRKGMNFKQDAYVPLPQAHSDDYRNSGWSKGHMAPAADFKWSENAMKESFYYTNCCPQDESLNSGQWSTLENKVRNWAEQFEPVGYCLTDIILADKSIVFSYNDLPWLFQRNTFTIIVFPPGIKSPVKTLVNFNNLIPTVFI